MKTVEWKICLKSSPNRVYELLNTAQGRQTFWAESAMEVDGHIHFKFINQWEYRAKILERTPDTLFKIDYFNSVVAFHLQKNEDGGTDLQLINSQVSEEEYDEMLPGWVSVLLSLKAAADHQIDLRSHHPAKTWDDGYVDV